jgi:hypothetical protein
MGWSSRYWVLSIRWHPHPSATCQLLATVAVQVARPGNVCANPAVRSVPSPDTEASDASELLPSGVPGIRMSRGRPAMLAAKYLRVDTPTTMRAGCRRESERSPLQYAIVEYGRCELACVHVRPHVLLIDRGPQAEWCDAWSTLARTSPQVCVGCSRMASLWVQLCRHGVHPDTSDRVPWHESQHFRRARSPHPAWGSQPICFHVESIRDMLMHFGASEHAHDHCEEHVGSHVKDRDVLDCSVRF